jgi:hypothetical protein
MNLVTEVSQDIAKYLNSNNELLFNERDFQMHLATYLRNTSKYDDVDLEYYVPHQALSNYIWESELRLDILKQIDDACDTPLVLHGGTGITPDIFRECIRNGVRKVNIATASFDAVTNAAKATTAIENANYFKLSAAMAEAVCENVENHIKIFNMKD